MLDDRSFAGAVGRVARSIKVQLDTAGLLGLYTSTIKPIRTVSTTDNSGMLDNGSGDWPRSRMTPTDICIAYEICH